MKKGRRSPGQGHGLLMRAAGNPVDLIQGMSIVGIYLIVKSMWIMGEWRISR